MAKRNLLEEGISESEYSDLGELEWAVAKTLLDANARTVQAFEYHILRTYREETSLNSESVQVNINQAIQEHRKIIEDLEVAGRAVAEMRKTESSDK